MYISLLNQSYEFKEFTKLFFPLLRSVLRYKRLINLFKQQMDIIKRRTVLRSLPSLLMLESTNKCNLDCSMCARTIYQSDRTQKDFDTAMFEKILNDLKDSVFLAMLWNYGEPFAAKNIFRMIELCRQNAVYSIITTNGFLLDEERIRKMIDSGLNYLKISCYINKNDDIAKYKSIVEKIASLKAGKKHPFVDAAVIIEDQPVHLLTDIHSILKDSGCDCVSFRRVDYHFDNDKEAKWKIRRMPNNKLCRRLYSLLLINSDGNAYPCCFDFRLDHKMGNICRNSPEEIWNSKAYQNFRDAYISGTKPDICRDCHSPDYNQRAYLTIKDLRQYEDRL